MRTYAATLLSVLILGMFAAHAVIGLHNSRDAFPDEVSRDHSGGHYDWG
jgi:hypothetical protein